MFRYVQLEVVTLRPFLFPNTRWPSDYLLRNLLCNLRLFIHIGQRYCHQWQPVVLSFWSMPFWSGLYENSAKNLSLWHWWQPSKRWNTYCSSLSTPYISPPLTSMTKDILLMISHDCPPWDHAVLILFTCALLSVIKLLFWRSTTLPDTLNPFIEREISHLAFIVNIQTTLLLVVW